MRENLDQFDGLAAVVPAEVLATTLAPGVGAELPARRARPAGRFVTAARGGQATAPVLRPDAGDALAVEHEVAARDLHHRARARAELARGAAALRGRAGRGAKREQKGEKGDATEEHGSPEYARPQQMAIVATSSSSPPRGGYSLMTTMTAEMITQITIRICMAIQKRGSSDTAAQDGRGAT